MNQRLVNEANSATSEIDKVVMLRGLQTWNGMPFSYHAPGETPSEIQRPLRQTELLKAARPETAKTCESHPAWPKVADSRRAASDRIEEKAASPIRESLVSV